MMPGNERLHAAGARRLFDALRAVPQTDAETDEELDLYVCDLLSDADKSRLRERIGRDPYLAEEIERRKADFAADPDPEQVNEITGKVLDAIFAHAPDSLSVVPHQFLSTPREPQETGSVFRPGWRLPGWLLIAAAFVILLGLAAVIVNHKGADQGIARNNSPDAPTPPSSPNAADIATVLSDQGKGPSIALNNSPASPPSSPNAADIAAIAGILFAAPPSLTEPKDGDEMDQLTAALMMDAMRTRFAEFKALLAKPEITESGLKIMGAENPEIDRKYEGQILSITYFDHSKKKLPFVLLPVQFEKGTAKVADEVSLESISRLSNFLKSVNSADFRVTIEVYTPLETSSEVDEQLSPNRAVTLRSMLEAQGVPRSILKDAKGVVRTGASRTLPTVTGDAQPSVLVIREH